MEHKKAKWSGGASGLNEKTLSLLFDYQRFEHEPELEALLDEVGDGAAADAVVMEENRQFGYLNPCTDDTVIRQKSGQVVAGGAIGVLCHEKIWFPTLPGNVMNA